MILSGVRNVFTSFLLITGRCFFSVRFRLADKPSKHHVCDALDAVSDFSKKQRRKMALRTEKKKRKSSFKEKGKGKETSAGAGAGFDFGNGMGSGFRFGFGFSPGMGVVEGEEDEDEGEVGYYGGSGGMEDVD